MTRDSIQCAEVSRGISAWHIYEFCTQGLQDQIRSARRILDLGCGRGDLGEFLRGIGYKAELHGADGVHYPDLRRECYQEFFQVNLDENLSEVIFGSYDFVLMPEVIHSLENPRGLVRRVVPLLGESGQFVFTTSNPLSIFSILILLRKGVFRSFQDGPVLYPTQITPIVPIDGRRIVLEAGLQVRTQDFIGKTRAPRASKFIQHWLPFLRGQWFSDQYRVVASR